MKNSKSVAYFISLTWTGYCPYTKETKNSQMIVLAVDYTGQFRFSLLCKSCHNATEMDK